MARLPRRTACHYNQPDQPACSGRRLIPFRLCLAHLPERDKVEYLSSLSYGHDVDFSSTRFTGELFSQVLDAVRDPVTGRAGFGLAKFSGAQFIDPVDFSSVDFHRDATFLRAHFLSDANFTGAQINAGIQFGHAELEKSCQFEGVLFHGFAIFTNATFKAASSFSNCTFSLVANFQAATLSTVTFTGAQFNDRCIFAGSTFNGVSARFSSARFQRNADFTSSSFLPHAQFQSAVFESDALFADSSLKVATFTEATFRREADFTNVVFGRSSFTRVHFSADVKFDNARFNNKAYFTEATFSKATWFRRAHFDREAHFVRAKFEQAKRMGPITSKGTIVFNGTSFESPIILEASAVELTLQQTEWSSTGVLRIRHARLNLSGATFAAAMTVATSLAPFADYNGDTIDDSNIGHSVSAKITSVQGTDVSKLLLVDVDLRDCRFSGAKHLDQIRLEGRCQFGNSPRGLHYAGWRITRWSQRRVLAEEAEWRASRPSPRGWDSSSRSASVGPAALSASYRHLRKSFEDSKNEPDAADFYYGEMEMRRNDTSRPRSERCLLTLYCLVSGYGLRAGRALMWLGAAIVATLASLIFWGLPSQTPTTVSDGVIRGTTFREVTVTPKPLNPTGPLGNRITVQRFDKAVRVVVNSVAFRSSGQALTTSGTYIEMSSRIVEPIFLGLALLAIRGRLKR
ncbi:pentapeptide repeat-containing protein [Streptomyces massasporeus]|uniref:pentapeptide repeat-containing protein n=1 Tax=Streptomyces massasporeus TaxID=67324 RepID=UPI003804D186